MKIVLDANIIRSSIRMNSDEFKVLFDFLSKTGSEIILPEIVFREVRAGYEKMLKDQVNAFLAAKANLRKLLPELEVQEISLDIAIEVEKYCQFLKHTLGLDEEGIAFLRPEYLEEVVDRAIRKLPPCTQKGEEFRDTLIWLTLLDIAKAAENKAAVFVSANSSEFGRQDLLPPLSKEAKQNGLSILYYSSLGDFIKSHSSDNPKYTRIWLEAIIDVEHLGDILQTRLGKETDYLVSYGETRLDRLTGYANPITTDLRLDDYFVYELQDGSQFVEFRCVGDVEIEYEYIKTERYDLMEHEWSWEYKGRYNYDAAPAYQSDKKCGYKLVSMPVTVLATVLIRDDQVSRLEVKDWDLA